MLAAFPTTELPARSVVVSPALHALKGAHAKACLAALAHIRFRYAVQHGIVDAEKRATCYYAKRSFKTTEPKKMRSFQKGDLLVFGQAQGQGWWFGQLLLFPGHVAAAQVNCVKHSSWVSPMFFVALDDHDPAPSAATQLPAPAASVLTALSPQHGDDVATSPETTMTTATSPHPAPHDSAGDGAITTTTGTAPTPAAVPAAQLAGLSKGFVKARKAYHGTQNLQLTFAKGDVFRVLQKEATGWWKVVGFFGPDGKPTAKGYVPGGYRC